MAMNYYDQDETPQGGSQWQSPGAPIQEGGDINPDGAAADPFAYTQGSLLTPWQGRFNSSGYNLGYSAPQYQVAAFNPHTYADFGYDYGPGVGKFEEQYQDPGAFRFADFSGPSDFKAPTAEEMRADPGYQARMDAVKNAQVAGAAHGGVLRSGGFQKGLAKAVGDQASQEYGNVYARRAGEHDRNRSEAVSNYGINQGNTFQSFNTNTSNRLQGYQTRQGTWKDNADVGMREGELKYNIATGTWDRNYGKSRAGWEDQRAHDQEVAQVANQQASANAQASASNARAAYDRDLGDYTRSRDEFWTNQDRQYGILDREANRGLQAAGQYGGQMMNGYGAQADYAMGGANAQASGTAASGAAWGNYAGDMGDALGGYAMYGGVYGGGGGSRSGGGGQPGPYAGGYRYPR